LTDFRRYTLDAGRIENHGQVGGILWTGGEVCVHGGDKLREADLTAIEGVE